MGGTRTWGRRQRAGVHYRGRWLRCPEWKAREEKEDRVQTNLHEREHDHEPALAPVRTRPRSPKRLTGGSPGRVCMSRDDIAQVTITIGGTKFQMHSCLAVSWLGGWMAWHGKPSVPQIVDREMEGHTLANLPISHGDKSVRTLMRSAKYPFSRKSLSDGVRARFSSPPPPLHLIARQLPDWTASYDGGIPSSGPPSAGIDTLYFRVCHHGFLERILALHVQVRRPGSGYRYIWTLTESYVLGR